jgi:hypothetical protein
MAARLILKQARRQQCTHNHVILDGAAQRGVDPDARFDRVSMNPTRHHHAKPHDEDKKRRIEVIADNQRGKDHGRLGRIDDSIEVGAESAALLGVAGMNSVEGVETLIEKQQTGRDETGRRRGPQHQQGGRQDGAAKAGHGQLIGRYGAWNLPADPLIRRFQGLEREVAAVVLDRGNFSGHLRFRPCHDAPRLRRSADRRAERSRHDNK